MKRKWLAIGISTVSVVFLILTSLSNVVGYQTVQTSNQNTIENKVNQRELLFQTIDDIANNKEIQRIILKSQMSRGIFPPSEFPVVTKQQLKQMSFIGLILSKVVSKSKIHSIIGKYLIPDSNIKKEINAIIEKNASLSAEISLLSKLNTHMNSTLFQILIWIIITSIAFISGVISGFFMVLLFFPTIIIVKYLDEDSVLYGLLNVIIGYPFLISFAIFFASSVLLWICFGMPDLGNQP